MASGLSFFEKQYMGVHKLSARLMSVRRQLRHWPALAFFLSLSLVGTFVLSGIAEARTVNFVIGCSGSVHQPPKIALTCADGKVVFYADNGWDEWGSTAASTRGTLTYPDCPSRVPLYACQNYAEDEAVVHLWRPVYCPTVSHWQFTRLRVTDLDSAGPLGFDGPSEYPCSSFKPEPVHYLGHGSAKAYMRAVLIQRFSYDSRAGGSIRCQKRLSKTRISCTMSWVIGDAGFFGNGRIWLTFRRHEIQAHFSYRLTNVDEYCLDVTPERDCTRKLRDQGQVPRYLVARRPRIRQFPDAQASVVCPSPGALERPANPRGAIPVAKEVVGSPTRVLEVKRGPRSTYATLASRDCGVEVLRKSIYINLHPVGASCVSCNSQLFLAKYRNGPWEVWASY